MAYILNIETSGINCSVSISNEENIVAYKETNTGQFTHAENLHVFIQDLFKETEIPFKLVQAVAVSSGPGSYTGLRIGISTAKGLCFAWNVPLIAIPTLEILAHNVISDEDFIIPMLDARRMEVYCSIFDKNKYQISPTEAKIIDEKSFEEYLNKGKVCFLGDGSDKFAEICSHPNAFFQKGQFPSARNMNLLAFKRFQNKQFENMAYFEPFYLKSFQTNPPKK